MDSRLRSRGFFRIVRLRFITAARKCRDSRTTSSRELNQISPLLIARFARERGLDPSVFNCLVRVSRAFTCFQLTELIRRVPKALATFSADVLIVTALPDLYFDEDVQDRPARASFEHALEGLQQLAPLQLSIAVFSDATSFKTKRHDFFKKLRNQADHILKLESDAESSLSFTCEKNTPLLSA